MTQHHCQGRETADAPVGLAAYGMDSHNTQRYVDKDGHARNEGDVQVGGFSPYPIGYKAIVPKKAQAANLLVPVCLSATHIAYGSIRMEPVFMVLGQSAATAACLSIDDNTAVQDLDQAKLHARLLADKQVLEWKGPRRTVSSAPPIDPKKLPGVVVDDEQAKLTGNWTAGSTVPPFVATGYRHDANTDKGQSTATFTAALPTPGRYEVRLSYSPNPNRATNIPVTIHHAGGDTTIKVNERQPAPIDGAWLSLGTFDFTPDHPATVTISNANTNGHVIIDAVQFLPAK
jgi:hypothetical protein